MNYSSKREGLTMSKAKKLIREYFDGIEAETRFRARAARGAAAKGLRLPDRLEEKRRVRRAQR